MSLSIQIGSMRFLVMSKKGAGYMKKLALISIALLVSIACVWSQQAGSVGETDPAKVGTDTAQQKLKEVSVTKFEDAGFWRSSMNSDMGLVSIRRIASDGSLDKEPVEGEQEAGIEESDQYVLGAKVSFYKRGFTDVVITPSRPIPVEGITKTVSVWVVGRNTRHTLKLILSDQFGNKAEITMGELNFTGWKKLTVAVPPSIVQRDYHYSNRMGIKIEGFRIIFDPMETYGRYYVYLDDLRVVTDLFAEENRDIDDILDSW